jgi:solute carrier family 34 (sodium-dependent phosphate cotransporter)
MQKKEIIKRIILLLIVIYVFLLSIKLMGSSFKMFGEGFSEILITFTTNPFVGLFIGILATSLVQSSSASTSVIVGLVASGALTIPGAIPIIMGANIGTSITNTIVSLGHITKKREFKRAFEVATIHDFFNFIVVLFLFPIEMIFHILEKSATFLTSFFVGTGSSFTFTNPLDYLIKPLANSIQQLMNNNPIIILIVALTFLFGSLRLFVKIMKPLAESNLKNKLQAHIFNSPIKTFLFGVAVTVLVQSSSVSTSLAVPFSAMGIVTLVAFFPYILGANVGTTITALLASLVTGSPAAVTIALCHLMFNIYGIALVYPIKKIPITLSKKLAEFSLQSKSIPFLYIGITFYGIPGLIIFFLH